MVFSFSKKRFIAVRSLFCLFICLLQFKYNTTNAQSIDFNLIAAQDLGLIYEKETDFETIRTIPGAIRLEINRARSRMEVQARIVSTNNFAFANMAENMYSISLRNTNQNLSRNYYKEVGLKFFDEILLLHNPTRNNPSNAFYEFDLTVKPVGFEVEPGGYFYSIIFTISPQ